MPGVDRTGRINPYIINCMAKNLPMRESFVGIEPHPIAVLLRMALLASLPGISLYALEVLK